MNQQHENYVYSTHSEPIVAPQRRMLIIAIISIMNMNWVCTVIIMKINTKCMMHRTCKLAPVMCSSCNQWDRYVWECWCLGVCNGDRVWCDVRADDGRLDPHLCNIYSTECEPRTLCVCHFRRINTLNFGPHNVALYIYIYMTISKPFCCLSYSARKTHQTCGEMNKKLRWHDVYYINDKKK